jgi:hypothetical protein
MRRTPRSSSTPSGADDGSGPVQVLEFASQAVEYVRRALGVTLEYDSETLPILDHYLRQVVSATPARPRNGVQTSTNELVAATAGAYFGEVVRRRLGGSWTLPSEDPNSWRLVLPSGLWFWPSAMAMAAILGPDGDIAASKRDKDEEDDDVVDAEPGLHESGDDDEDDEDGWDASLQVPEPLRSHVARVLDGMADVSEEEYYSLCCRLDTLEHIQAVLVAMASARRSPDGSGASE